MKNMSWFGFPQSAEVGDFVVMQQEKVTDFKSQINRKIMKMLILLAAGYIIFDLKPRVGISR